MLGITFKENCPDIRNTRAIDIYQELKSYDLDIDVYDPWADPTGTPASPPAPVEAAGVGGADIIGAAAVPTTGTVSVKGDAANVQFVGAGQTSGAGTLAPGTYTLMVTFGVGEAPASAGQVTVSAGATTTVTCKSSFRRCSSH